MTNSTPTMSTPRTTSTAGRPDLNPATDLSSSRHLTVADRLNLTPNRPGLSGRPRIESRLSVADWLSPAPNRPGSSRRPQVDSHLFVADGAAASRS